MSIEKINSYLSEKGVAVIPGFQGISKLGEITSIGRGGSDATAVAIAKIFEGFLLIQRFIIISILVKRLIKNNVPVVNNIYI